MSDCQIVPDSQIIPDKEAVVPDKEAVVPDKETVVPNALSLQDPAAIISNNDVNVEILSLIQLLTNVTNPGASLSKYNLKIDESVKQVLLAVMTAHPNFFSEVELILVNITKDNKIDSADIPNIIVLIQKLYILMVDLKSIKLTTAACSETCGSIIKIIIHVLVEEGVVKITTDNKEVFLANVDKLVNACVDLLKFTKQLKPKNCLHFFKF
jgi:hypothetical protein